MQIYKAIPAIIKEIEAVKKKKSDNAEGSVKYAYRRIDDFMNALNPLLGEKEVTLVPEIVDVVYSEAETRSGSTMNCVKIKMKYTLYASDGSSVSGVTIGEGFDTGDKASGKAQSNALKYFIMPTFMVPTEDIDDTDGHEHDEIKKANQTSPEEYVINLGEKNKMTGTRLQDHKPEWLQKYIDSQIKWHTENNKKPHKNTQEFIDRATAYIKSLPNFNKDESIPF